MELKTVEIVVYILIPILTAGLGGWVGAYFGNTQLVQRTNIFLNTDCSDIQRRVGVLVLPSGTAEEVKRNIMAGYI